MATPGPDVDVDILLMGMTGVGKSATGNAILGRRHFKSRGGAASVTKEFHGGITRVGGRTIRVVDIPGFQDTDNANTKDQAEIVSKELARALLQVRNGFDAVLLVYPYTRRLTPVDKDCIMTFLKLFDKKAFTEHGVLVLTQGDQFRREVEDMTLPEWIASQNKDQDWLPVLCESRCVLFDNATDNQEVKDAQVNELLGVIDGFKGWNKYIPEICRLNGEIYDAFVHCKEKVVQYERVLHELAVLEHLAWVGGSPHNIAKVNEQGIAIYNMMSTHSVCDDVSLTIEMKDATRLFDGSKRRRDELCTIIQSLQLNVESKMRDTEFGRVFEQTFFEKFWEDLKAFGAAVISTCNIL